MAEVEKEPEEEQPLPEAYRVGHGGPPLETRFRPGQSGNPRGRPKGSKNTRTLLQEKLSEKVRVRTPQWADPQCVETGERRHQIGQPFR